MLNYRHGILLLHPVDSRTIMPDTEAVVMSPKKLIKRLSQLARQRCQRFEWRPDQGKGSRGMVYLGSNRAVISMHAKTLTMGTLHAICKQLDIKVSE